MLNIVCMIFPIRGVSSASNYRIWRETGLVAMLVLGPACRAWVAMGVADLIMGVRPVSCPGVQILI